MHSLATHNERSHDGCNVRFQVYTFMWFKWLWLSLSLTVGFLPLTVPIQNSLNTSALIWCVLAQTPNNLFIHFKVIKEREVKLKANEVEKLRVGRTHCDITGQHSLLSVQECSGDMHTGTRRKQCVNFVWWGGGRRCLTWRHLVC